MIMSLSMLSLYPITYFERPSHEENKDYRMSQNLDTCKTSDSLTTGHRETNREIGGSVNDLGMKYTCAVQ